MMKYDDTRNNTEEVASDRVASPDSFQGASEGRRYHKPMGGGRNAEGASSGPSAGGGRRPFFRRRKVCLFCADKLIAIDYKNPKLLSRFVTERGKMVPSRITGVCAPHQRALSRAIKQARQIALLPFLVK